MESQHQNIGPTHIAIAKQLRPTTDAPELSPRVRSISRDGLKLYDVRRLDHSSVRLARPDDLKFVVALQKQFSNELGWIPDKGIAENIAAGQIGIATAGKWNIGYIYARPALGWQPLLRSIVQIAVLPNHQRRHVALQMLAAVVDAARKAGQVGIQAITRTDLKANGFWLCSDFRPVCMLEASGARNHPKIVWRLPLVKRVPVWFIEPPRRAGWKCRLVGDKHNAQSCRRYQDPHFPPPVEPHETYEEPGEPPSPDQASNDTGRNESGRVEAE